MVTLMLLAHSSTLFSLLELTPLSTEHTLYLPQARADQWRASFTPSPPSLEAPPASFPQFSKRLQERTAHYLGFFSVAVIKIPDKTNLKEKSFFFHSPRGVEPIKAGETVSTVRDDTDGNRIRKLVNHPALTCRKQRGDSKWGQAAEPQSSLLLSRLYLLNAPQPSQIMPQAGDPVFKHSRLCSKHFIFKPQQQPHTLNIQTRILVIMQDSKYEKQGYPWQVESYSHTTGRVLCSDLFCGHCLLYQGTMKVPNRSWKGVRKGW